MGAYLSHPNTETHPEDGEGNGLTFGASSMQGWRASQEDAHNCIVNFDKSSSLFSVYDGHGGSEVAVYLSQHFPELLRNTKSYKLGDWGEALREAYLEIDASIKAPNVLKEIVRLSKFGRSVDEDIDGNADENVNQLYEEATMPIEMLVAKYREIRYSTSSLKDEQKPGCSSKNALDDELTPSCSASSSGASQSSASLVSKSVPVTKSTAEEADDSTTSKVESSTASALSTASSSHSSPMQSSSISTEQISINEHKNEENNSLHKNGENSKEQANEAIHSNTANDVNGDVSHTNEESTENGPEKVNGQTESKAVDSEKSILAVPAKKKKGKTFQAPILKQVEHNDASKKRKSPREITKNYIELLNGEESSDDSDEDEDDPGTFEVSEDSDDEGDEGEEEDSEEEEDGDDMEDDSEDYEVGDEEDDDEEDDEMLKDLQEPGYDSGSTAVTAFTRWDGNKLQLWVANAGDSRCVVSRNGKAFDMSEDHKPEDEKESKRIVAAGGKVTSEGRVNGGLNLSRAIGDHSYKTNPALPLHEQMITALPDIKYVELDPATDKFMILACDGIWNSLSSQQVVDFIAERIVNPSKKLSAICDELFRACLAHDTAGDGTGCDNMTAIIVEITGNEQIDTKVVETEPVSETTSTTNSSNGGVKRQLNGDGDEAIMESKKLKFDPSTVITDEVSSTNAVD